eukprot:scaffold207_cov409-Prasinococcus_capsulatus_cf.AAC.13
MMPKPQYSAEPRATRPQPDTSYTTPRRRCLPRRRCFPSQPTRSDTRDRLKGNAAQRTAPGIVRDAASRLPAGDGGPRVRLARHAAAPTAVAAGHCGLRGRPTADLARRAAPHGGLAAISRRIRCARHRRDSAVPAPGRPRGAARQARRPRRPFRFRPGDP